MKSIFKKAGYSGLLALATLSSGCSKDDIVAPEPAPAPPTQEQMLNEMCAFIRGNSPSVDTNINADVMQSYIDSVLVNGKKLTGSHADRVASSPSTEAGGGRLTISSGQDDGWRRYYFGNGYYCTGFFSQVHTPATVTMKNNATGLTRQWNNVKSQVDAILPIQVSPEESVRTIDVYMKP